MYRKFLSNSTGASKRDIWTRAGNMIAPSLKKIKGTLNWRYFVNACTFTEPYFTELIIT